MPSASEACLPFSTNASGLDSRYCRTDVLKYRPPIADSLRLPLTHLESVTSWNVVPPGSPILG